MGVLERGVPGTLEAGEGTFTWGVRRRERMGVLERGVPGTLEAGEGTFTWGVRRRERMGVLERGVPGTLEAGEGTGELVCEEDVSDAELLPEIYTGNGNVKPKKVGVRPFL